MVCASMPICVYGALALVVLSLTGCDECTLVDVCGTSGSLWDVGSNTSCCKSFKAAAELYCASPSPENTTVQDHICAVKHDCLNYASWNPAIKAYASNCPDAVHDEGTTTVSASRPANVLREAIMETLDRQVKTISISESRSAQVV